MKRMASIIAGCVLSLTLAGGAMAASACNNGNSASGASTENDKTSYTVTYNSNGGTAIADSTVDSGEKLTAPSTPVRNGYTFGGWYTSAECTADSAYSFTENVSSSFTLYAKWDEVEEQPTTTSKVTTINYLGQEVTLSDKALYVNCSLTDEQTSEYAFNSLQACVAAAKDGTKNAPTVIYLEADVYWTDDYTSDAVRQSDDLIGLEISQSYITMLGMTGNKDDVVIASDRGQNAGANGNFNTIGISTGFHAKDITFGNYCNVDLVYSKDTSKNHEMRQSAITQAQVITKAKNVEVMDEWYFEDCSFVSRLNLFSRDERPYRTLYNNCHFECTDDSIGTGYISIYQGCDFDFYSNTPCGGASFYLQAYLGCKFTTHFTSDNTVLTLCKNTKPFAFIDCEFYGNMTAMEWKQANITDDIRNIVYNNTLNGQPLTISESYPNCSVTPSKEAMLAFKVGETYNVYNLLNGISVNGVIPETWDASAEFVELENWDPLGQQDELERYVSPWNIQFGYEGKAKDVTPALVGDEKTEFVITPLVYGFADTYTTTWTTDSEDYVTLKPNDDGSVTVVAKNYDFVDKDVTITCTMGNGLSKVLHMTITSPTLSSPSVEGDSALAVADGTVNLTYALSANELSEAVNPDNSVIEWYRSNQSDGSNAKIIATTTYVRSGSTPYVSYKLTNADIGHYITAVIKPQYKHTEAGESVSVTTSAAIKAEDLTDSETDYYTTDFSNLAYITATNDTKENNYEWTDTLESGYWYGGFYLPAEYRADGAYSSKAFDLKDEDAWTYAEGASGAAGLYGMQTTTQGARLVYVDDTERGDMSMTVELSPHKTAAQGFGSALQYLDIFFKYDAKTMTGYGLRIQRESTTDDDNYKDYLAKSCSFQLVKYTNGVAEGVSDKVFSTAFLPGCTVTIDMTGTTLSCTVTTTTAQDSQYPDYMSHSVSLSCDVAANNYSGFGFQHTGTAGAGKSGNRTTITGLTVDYKTAED